MSGIFLIDDNDVDESDNELFLFYIIIYYYVIIKY